MIGILHLGGKDLHSRPPCRRVFLTHNEVSVLKYARGNKQGEKLTFLHRTLNIGQKALAGGEKLVIPYRNITAARNCVNDPHKLVGITAVLLTVA